MTLTARQLRAALRYDPVSGVFHWRTGRPGRTLGAVGTLNADGYVVITIDYRKYYAHRLAFLYMNGVWPVRKIDHDDGDRQNNRWYNLREATNELNSRNRREPSKNAISLGVSWDSSRGKYTAQLYADGARRLYKRFDTLEEAQQAYAAAKRQWHGIDLPA